MRRMMLAIAVLVLSGCVQTGSDSHAQLLAEKRVEQLLKDPDSAKFSGVFVVRKPGTDDLGSQTIYTCGQVNAKNAFGGYPGEIRFIVQQSLNTKLDTFGNIYAWLEEPQYRTLHPESAADKPESYFERLHWNQACVDGTHPPSYTAQSS